MYKVLQSYLAQATSIATFCTIGYWEQTDIYIPHNLLTEDVSFPIFILRRNVYTFMKNNVANIFSDNDINYIPMFNIKYTIHDIQFSYLDLHLKI